MEVELGLGLQGDKTAEEYVALARMAEASGFDVVTVFHDLLFQPSFYPLLLVAQATERVRLGASALNPFTLHPVEIAGQVAALDALSGGRAYLGLVRGAWLESVGVDPSRGLTAIRETVEIVQRLLCGDREGFTGELFALKPGQVLRYEVLRTKVPLLIGTWAPRLARYAGEVADELKIGGSANPELVPVVRDLVGNPDVGIVVGAVTVVDEDGAAARRRARAEVAMYLPVVAPRDPTLSMPLELVERVQTLVAAGDHEAAGALVPDDLLDRFAFSGTPDQVTRQAQALFEAGAKRVEFGTPQGLTNRRGVELLGSRVLPALR